MELLSVNTVSLNRNTGIYLQIVGIAQTDKYSQDVSEVLWRFRTDRRGDLLCVTVMRRRGIQHSNYFGVKLLESFAKSDTKTRTRIKSRGRKSTFRPNQQGNLLCVTVMQRRRIQRSNYFGVKLLEFFAKSDTKTHVQE